MKNKIRRLGIDNEIDGQKSTNRIRIDESISSAVPTIEMINEKSISGSIQNISYMLDDLIDGIRDKDLVISYFDVWLRESVVDRKKKRQKLFTTMAT